MAKITSKASLNIGTELTLDTAAKTIKLNVAGNLIAKDGVTFQALYSKLVDLWMLATYNDFPFPAYAIDALSGQFQLGTDGQSYNGWKPLDDTTRQMLRDGGWSEWSSTGLLNRQYVGIVSLGAVSTGSQLYYQNAGGAAPVSFTFTDAANQGIQVFGSTANGDATAGNFDSRTYFKAFVREYNKIYKDSVLADTGKTATGAYIVNMLLSNDVDLNIQANDAAMSSLPYSGMSITYYTTDQLKTVGSTTYPYRVVINGNNATLEQIYTFVQWSLRQTTDIDAGVGVQVGKTASALLSFTGSTLQTTQGVFVTNIQAADSNRIIFKDQNSVDRSNPYAAAGSIAANSVLIGAGSTYRLIFTTLPGGASVSYGGASAVTVNDSTGTPITGSILTASTAFTFDYDGNVQGGRTPAVDAAVMLIGVRPGYGKFVVAAGTLTRSKAIQLSLVAETDRAYL